MDRKYINTHLLTDRYLLGTLTEGELAEFEERLVWDQELIDDVELAEKLRDAVRRSVMDDSYKISEVGASVVGRLWALFSVPQYAAAASFLLAVTLTAGVLLNVFPSDRDFMGESTPTEIGVPENRWRFALQSSEVASIATEIVPLVAVRSERGPTIAVNDATWVVLLVDAPASYDSYRVSVREDESGADPFWVQDDLSPTYPDALAVGMPGSALAAGRYVLSLAGALDSGSGEKTYEHIQEISFETTAAD
jgi:hypothetical protein